MTILAVAFWLSAGALLYAQLGYPAVLWALAHGRRDEGLTPSPSREGLPSVSLIVAAHDEEAVIEEKVREATTRLDYPRERLEVIVASDGSADRTAELAREAGADLVLDLPRGGKVAALNAAVERARGEVLAFSDANSFWEPDALRHLVSRLADPRVGYVCGQVRPDGAAAMRSEGADARAPRTRRAARSRGARAGHGGASCSKRRPSSAACGRTRPRSLPPSARGRSPAARRRGAIRA